MFARQRVRIVEGSLTQEGQTLVSLLLVCQMVRHLTQTTLCIWILIRLSLVMAMIISETESESNPHERINEREQEDDSEKILDNCELGLDLVVVHGDHSSGVRG